jgi:hypothetical protein
MGFLYLNTANAAANIHIAAIAITMTDLITIVLTSVCDKITLQEKRSCMVRK